MLGYFLLTRIIFFRHRLRCYPGTSHQMFTQNKIIATELENATFFEFKQNQLQLPYDKQHNKCDI